MKKVKKILSVLFAVVLVFTTGVPAFAAVNDTGFSDVDADAWYTEAVVYCRDNNIMSGTTNTEFAPQGAMSRAMLAAVLWRMDGSPSAAVAQTFTDVASGQWYSEAVAWAASEGIVSGTGNQTFSPNDPVTREQIAVLLYRYAEHKGENVSVSPALGFTDTGEISSWAVDAIAWAKENSIISGKPGNLFDPKGNATRAETAVILHRYLTTNQSEAPINTEPEPSADTGKILVAYFSRTGNTQTLANTIHELAGGDLFEIVPLNPYPTDYNECLDRASQELAADSRPALATHVEDIDAYDVIFIGYPIWHGNTPMPIRSFLEEYDLSGKVIVPFCTSGGSGISGSLSVIRSICSGSTILDGLGIRSSDAGNAKNSVQTWLDGLGIEEYLNARTKNENSGAAETTGIPKLKITVGDTVLTATLLDNPTTRDLLTMLPLTLTFSDYNSTEKISYPPRSLSTEDAPSGYAPSAGDITVYAPWGNIAIFYKDFRYGNGLIPIGRFDSGIETLAGMSGDFAMTIEIAN